MWVQVGFNIALFVALAIASLLLTRLLGEDSSAPDLLPAIEAARLPLWGGLIWGITAVVAIGLAFSSRLRWIPAVNIGGMLAFIVLVIAVAFPLMDTQRQLPLRQLSLQAAAEVRLGEPVVAIGFMKPSITFYMQQNIQYASGPSEFDRVLADWQASPDDIPTGLVLGEAKLFDDWTWDEGSLEAIADAGAYRLVRIAL